MSICVYNKGITKIFNKFTVISISREENYMYISSTNLFIDLPEYSIKESPNWITSEKYYNCENFFTQLNQKTRKHLWKHKIPKNR